MNLLDGSFLAQQFQVGANANQTIGVSVSGATTDTLGNFGGASTLTVATNTATATTAWTVANSIVLNGVTIGASNATSTPGVSGGSAYAKAAAINAQSTLTGVTATAFTTTNSAQGAVSTTATAIVTASATGASTASGQLWINNVAIGAISAGSTELGQIQNAANAINAVTSQTGVTAIADATTGKLQLSAGDGRDIQVTTDSAADQTAVLNATGIKADVYNAGTTLLANGNLNSATVNYTTDTGLFTGALTLNSSAAINITYSGATAQAAGGLTGYSAKLASLSTLDITSVTGSNAAINIIDAAINQINGQQANLGAIQNRFTSTISNLQTSSTNLSAARSRIEDTDYAAETANLAHYQILQQAGNAMLAQANSLPNSILTLLR